jgi:hypothetical protein
MSYSALISKAAAQPRRPIVFDGIDQQWFKHKRDREYAADNWGRSTDFEKILLGSGSDFDGAPEAVSESFQVVENFRCVFVGRAIEDPPSRSADFIWRLCGERDLRTIARKVEALLGRR